LTIHTNACKGLETAVDYVFPGVEHRECMRHFASNLGKSFKGKLIDDNLWPASLTYSLRKHNYHVNQLYTNSRLKIYIESVGRRKEGMEISSGLIEQDMHL
jgi:transposase-like protein